MYIYMYLYRIHIYMYIETQASLYVTFYTESPKAEGRNTFVFCS